MTTSILINALGQALFESFGQALLIYVVLQLVMQFFPALGSKYRYDVNYLGLTIICCWFLANLVNIYLHNMAMPHYTAMLYTGGMAYASHYTPTVLQQVEAFIAHYAKYITGVYLLALMVQGIRLIGGFMHVQQIRKEQNLRTDHLWSAKAKELMEKLKILKQVSLFFSEHVQIPLTIGYLKPIIIFPIALINNLDNDQVEAILLHELAHIKRHDYLLNIIQCVMETILCFNPFVWLISKTIREQREFCCDDMVIDEDCNNYSYSRALFIIAQQNEQNYTLAMASTGSKKYPLLNRIKRLNMKTNDTLPKFHLLVVLAVAALGLLLAWGIPQYSHAKAAHHNKIKHFSITTSAKAYVPNPPAAPAPAASKPQPVIATPQPDAQPAIPDTIPAAKQVDTGRKHTVTTNITITDDNGNTRRYHSLAEMPAADKEEFLKENPGFDGNWVDTGNFASFRKFKMDPQFQQQMAEMGRKMKEQYNSPEWRRQMADMRAKMNAMYNSPEWKKQMADMNVKMKEQFNSPEWKKQMADMTEKFNSPEWKKQIADMKEKFNSPEWKKQMADMQVKMKEQFNSPEWKKQMADMQVKMKEQFNNPEWKKQMADMQMNMKKQFNSPEWKKQMEDMKLHMKNFNKDSRERMHELEKQNEQMREELRKNGDHKFDEAKKDTVK